MDYLVSKKTIEAALANDRMTLDDYDATIFGLVSDGVDWVVLEDSLDEPEAIAWAERARSYGEHVGLYEWVGA